MLVVLGVLLLAATVVLFQWAYIEHNRPSPKSWTQPEFVAHTIALVTTSTLAAGIALGVAAFLGIENHPITATHAFTALAIVGVTAVLVVGMRAWWRRLRAMARHTAVVHGLQVPANDSGPGIPPRRAGARAKRRRAA